MTPRSRTPRKLPEPTESQSQIAFFKRVSLDARTRALPIFHIANGGHRHVLTAKRLKAEGVKAGVPDIFVAVPKVAEYAITLHSGDALIATDPVMHKDILAHGLFIEMKRRGNKPTPEQMRWISDLNTRGYQVHVCYGAESAWLSLMEYLGYSRRPKLCGEVLTLTPIDPR